MQSVDGAPWPLWRSKRPNSHGSKRGSLPGLASELVFERDLPVERPRPRGRRRLLAAIAIFILSFAGTRFSAALWNQADQVAVMAGFGLQQIAVSGHRNTPEEDIFKAVGAPGGDGRMHATLTLDVIEARRRLEALAWVETARVVRLLPDAIDIEITEREPFAVWQRRGLVFLIDRDGRSLQPIAPTDYPGLPLIVGEGAASGAAAIFAEIARHPAIASRVSAVLRVAERRWSLQLTNGVEIMLPADEPGAALDRVAGLDARNGLLERAIEVVDLREPGRVVVRLSEGGAMAREQLRAAKRKLALAGALAAGRASSSKE